MCKKSCFHHIVSLQTHALPPPPASEMRKGNASSQWAPRAGGWDGGGGSPRNDRWVSHARNLGANGIPKGGRRTTLQKLGCCPPTRRSGRGGERGIARQRAAAAPWEVMGSDLLPGLIPSPPSSGVFGANPAQNLFPRMHSLPSSPHRRVHPELLCAEIYFQVACPSASPWRSCTRVLSGGVRGFCPPPGL